MKIQIIKVIMKKLLKTALYARCASKEENKPSPVESQLKELREACKDSQIVKEYVDEAENGVDLNRSGLRRLLKDAKKGLFGTLYVFDPDRLSRNYAQLLQILKELEKNGVKVNFLRGGGPELQFQLMLCNSMAEYEKQFRSQATKRGIAKAKEKKNQEYRTPFGYKKEKVFILDEKNVPLVRRAFELYASGNYSMRELMSLMAKEGLQISKGRLARILSNSFYIGKIKNVKGNYKPLIDEKTFDTVQGMLRKRLN